MDAMDNVKNYPARMSDGRFLTNFNSSCVNNLLLSKGMNSYTYRQMLISNAEKLMKDQVSQNEKNFSCKGCPKMIIPKTKYEQDCSGDVCTIKRTSDGGIGIDNL
tara:strand:+ start:6747 stop:7061 length:315 start_codon:yes stop_codon:yes gene_type:complete